MNKNVSLVIPTYRNPKCLDVCLRSAVENRADAENKIIVVVDGFFSESEEVLKKYADDVYVIDNVENKGMQVSQNTGVMLADTKYIWIINDDNVMAKNWDTRVLEEMEKAERYYGDKVVLTVNQIEPPTGGYSMFHFPVLDLGRTADTFDYDKWQEVEQSYCHDKLEMDGNIYPFVIEKKWYLACGGFDTFYNSPNICDWDFFLKLQLLGFKSPRTYNLYCYHFGSVATKKNPEAGTFKTKEMIAMEAYEYKWGASPCNQDISNSKYPTDGQFRGFNV